MNKIARIVLAHKKTVLALFVLTALVCVFLMLFVNVNYSLSDYLPEQAPSTVALDVMMEEFGQALPNVNAYIPDVTIPQALEYKSKIAALDGVTSVLWLDDVYDINTPLFMGDESTIQSYYKHGGALFTITVSEEKLVEATDALYELVGEDGALSGEGINEAASRKFTGKEMVTIALLVVPLGLLILMLSSDSWFEPVLFLLTIGFAILINEGTNIFLGSISFVTRATSAILQLAVSLDYAVFLLHSFARLREQGLPIEEAMRRAMVESASSIAASGMTTVLGFLALCVMQFRIGPDMGIVLAKGIFLSMVAVMLLLPVMVLFTYRLIDKTRHKPFVPSFAGLSRWIVRIGVPVLVLVALLAVPCYLAQGQNDFLYGSSGMSGEETRAGQDTALIQSIFGESNQMALLVPRGNLAAEQALQAQLEQTPRVTSVISYVSAVDAAIPQEFVPEGQLSQLVSEHYSRFILLVDTGAEGDTAFRLVETIREVAQSFYPDSYHLVGTSVNTYDIMDTITSDSSLVNLLAMVAIGVVILLTFRSLSIPLILIFTIESAIWINLSLPYFLGTTLNYIGYLIISSVQLGATVDYGILLSNKYLAARETMDKKQAIAHAFGQNAVSILVPASILVVAGLSLGIVSSNGVISQLGTVLGRGAAISAALVLLMLPTLLVLLDTLIRKTTLRPPKKKEGAAASSIQTKA